MNIKDIEILKTNTTYTDFFNINFNKYMPNTTITRVKPCTFAYKANWESLIKSSDNSISDIINNINNVIETDIVLYTLCKCKYDSIPGFKKEGEYITHFNYHDLLSFNSFEEGKMRLIENKIEDLKSENKVIIFLIRHDWKITNDEEDYKILVVYGRFGCGVINKNYTTKGEI